MNAIPHLRSIDTSNMSDLETIIYFYLLSKCSTDDDDMILTEVSDDSLKRQFKLKPKDLTQLIQTFVDEGLIYLEDDIIYVGYKIEGTKDILLYPDEDDDEEDIDSFSELIEFAESLLRSRRATTKMMANNCIENLKRLERIKPAEYRVPELLQLFKASTSVILQEEYRNFEKKEAGMMKNFLKAMGGKKAVRALLNYVQNFDRFGSIPRIDNLLANKDEAYALTLKVKDNMDDETF